MNKDELERIKQAYNSGLKVQIWFNGHWENFDTRDYSMYSEPFSEHRQYRIVGSDYANIAEKRIAELEKEIQDLEGIKLAQETALNREYIIGEQLQKENAELKTRNGELAGKVASLERWFGEAKEIIKLGLRAVNTSSAKYMSEYEHKAEAFLKESE